MSAGLANLKLDKPISQLSGISDVRANKFAQIGIHNIRELINLFPSYYLNLEDSVTIAQANIGNYCILNVQVEDIQSKNPKPELKLTEVAFTDKTGIVIATFFSKPWISKKFEVGDNVIVFGYLEFSYGFKRMKSPTILHLVDVEQKMFAMYDLPKSLSRNTVSKCISAAITYLFDDISYLPNDIIERYNLMKLLDAYWSVHFPQSIKDAAAGRRTIKFYQLFMFFLYRLKGNLLQPCFVDDLDELDVLTKILPHASKNEVDVRAKVFYRDCLDDAFNVVFDQLEAGFQAAFLCPLIGVDRQTRNIRAGNRSGQLSGCAWQKSNYYCVCCNEDYNNENYQSAQKHSEILQQQKFSTYTVDFIAGNKNSSRSRENTSDFLKSKLDVVVMTRPNLQILKHNKLGALVIEDADRFSLYELNQIRSFLSCQCKMLLIRNTKNKTITDNLETFCTCNNLYQLLELDFDLITNGSQLSSRIEGSALLTLVDFNRDSSMAKYAYLEASKIIQKDPSLSKLDNKLLSYELSRQIGKS